ncbi:MAG: hypothetical protein EAZ80_09115, partial [Runella slithyformis]
MDRIVEENLKFDGFVLTFLRFPRYIRSEGHRGGGSGYTSRSTGGYGDSGGVARRNDRFNGRVDKNGYGGSGRSKSGLDEQQLRRINWSQETLAPLRKNFYKPNPSVLTRSRAEIEAYQRKHEVTVRGHEAPTTIFDFNEVGFPSYITTEMQRQGFGDMPLLIGGATTSRTHTAVKIAPAYKGPVIYVTDASRAVPVAGKLTQTKETYQQALLDIKAEYVKMREDHAKRTKAKDYINIEAARANKTKIDWDNYTPTQPQWLGNRYFNNYPLEDIAKYIDWTPFFQTWQLSGKYPKIFDDAVVGNEAKKLFDDAKAMLAD